MSLQGISVVIPNYNGRILLPIVIPTVQKALLQTSLPCEIILSDDCSTDDSVQSIKMLFPEVVLIVNEQNLGFSSTINRGIRQAKYRYVLLMNNDVKLEQDYFIHQLRYFDRADTFGVMGRIIGWDNVKIQDGAKYPRYHGCKIKTNGNYISQNPQKDHWLPSIYLSGANALIDRDKLLKLGGFNELFSPFYVEDYELSIRAWRLGWKCYYEHFSVCRHAESITIKSKSSKKFIRTVYNRNKMFLHALHLNGYNLVCWHIQLIGEVLLYSIVGKFYYLKSFIQYLSKTKEVVRSRKRLSSLINDDQKLLDINKVFRSVQKTIEQYPVKKF